MAITKQMNIKNRTYCFYNDLIKYFDFDPNMLKLDKKIFKGIDIYYIRYVTKKEEYKINSVSPLYLLIYKVDGFIEEKRGNSYLNIAFTDNNDLVSKNIKKSSVGLRVVLKKYITTNLENMKKII